MDAVLKTADELVALGEKLQKLGQFIVYLYPSQEWMAVELQMPFVRYNMNMEIEP